MSELSEACATSRTAALLGDGALSRLGNARVTVVGVGGVGSWCAEALVRTGVGHVTLVDDDRIVASNLNRQCPATAKTLGRPKVEAMRERLLEVMPTADVTAVAARYTGGVLPGGPADVVVDAIDSTDCKAELILSTLAADVPLVSSMGAARRTDPTKVRVTRFEKVEGDGLAKALRRRFKKLGRFPKGRFACVWSAECPAPAIKRFHESNNQTVEAVAKPSSAGEARTPPLRRCGVSPHQEGGFATSSISKGSLMTVTATFGMCLAAEVIRSLVEGGTAATVLPRPPRQERKSHR